MAVRLLWQLDSVLGNGMDLLTVYLKRETAVNPHPRECKFYFVYLNIFV